MRGGPCNRCGHACALIAASSQLGRPERVLVRDKDDSGRANVIAVPEGNTADRCLLVRLVSMRNSMEVRADLPQSSSGSSASLRGGLADFRQRHRYLVACSWRGLLRVLGLVVGRRSADRGRCRSPSMRPRTGWRGSRAGAFKSDGHQRQRARGQRHTMAGRGRACRRRRVGCAWRSVRQTRCRRLAQLGCESLGPIAQVFQRRGEQPQHGQRWFAPAAARRGIRAWRRARRPAVDRVARPQYSGCSAMRATSSRLPTMMPHGGPPSRPSPRTITRSTPAARLARTERRSMPSAGGRSSSGAAPSASINASSRSRARPTSSSSSAASVSPTMR